ncbi:MAG: tRNA (adenosine(37)-N6)-threonylcarbamoyltransferase complex dimerization subunit type 1 TsaB [Prolixibacteraceae bacterium]|nr:tRNA (adenosine(37)-N6)-threonylcarbamoyltransferase complex dimerization subunit type 1 TsaB [Prolixibacteraceae bacterium]
MSKILCIETSTEVCSVAIADNGKITDLREDQSGMNHSRLLTVFIDELLKANTLSMSNFDAVAVSRGPGSYTGLRIGVSAAKGLCYGAGIPLIAICPLKAMAATVLANTNKLDIKPNETAWLVPMIDARRMEVYLSIYSVNMENISDVEAVIVDEKTFADALSERYLFFFGNGAEKCKAVIQSENAIFVENIIASASNMATLAEECFQKKEFADVAYFEPFYLKDFIATIPRKNLLF